jgi:hypothetical protein
MFGVWPSAFVDYDGAKRVYSNFLKFNCSMSNRTNRIGIIPIPNNRNASAHGK